MLTKSERRFVQNSNSFSKDYAYVIRNRLNKKLKQLRIDFEQLKGDLKLIIKKNDELRLDIEVLDGIFDLGDVLQNTVRNETKISSTSSSEMSILDKNKMA
jgi:regulator of replication initiation timing